MLQRPTGVTIIAVLFFLGGIGLILTGIVIWAVPIPAGDPLLGVVTGYVIVIGLVFVVLGGAEFALGWGLWSLRNWARITAVVFFGLGAASNLVSGISFIAGIRAFGVRLSYPGPGVAMLAMAIIQGIVIWYLTKPDVAMLFDAQYGGPILEPTLLPTRVPETQFTPPPPPPPQPTYEAPSRAPAAIAPRTSPRPQPTELYGQQPRPTGWLVARNGGQAGKNFGLKAGDTTIGRDTRRADIVLDTSTISGEHARVRYEGGQFFLYDLASTNGTFINNRQIQKQILRDGDVVRCGEAEFVFKRVA